MKGFAFAAAAMVGLSGSLGVAQDKAGQHTVLVELFTSEGCSSCPPADALLQRLDGTQVNSGDLVVGLSEHVTYWNSLGWADPFSQDAFTRRQQAYGERLRLDSVYTPQVVVNGEAQVVGSDRGGVLRAIAGEKDARKMHLRIEEVSVGGGKVAASYTLDGDVASQAEVWAVIADDKASSTVTRGENGGRTLTHVSVARSLTKVGRATSGEMKLSLTEPGLVAGAPKTGRHLVLFVQEAGYGKVLAVESKAL